MICIVGGCGHVGLPLGICFARAGLTVRLLDVDAARVAGVQAGIMPFRDAGADEGLREGLQSGRLCATTDPTVLRDSDTVVITIGTPIDGALDPHLELFDAAMRDVLDQCHDGQLMILRSTVFPGVTDRLARQLELRGLKLDLAYCPERVAQGIALEEQAKFPQLVGGTTPVATRRARQLFERIGAAVMELTPVEAELGKLFSNAYRYINFAISNQFWLIAHRLGADFYRIHQAATLDYPRLAGFSPAGFAGGPCLLKDTMQLAGFNHSDFVLGQAAMMINEGLPAALLEIVRQKRDLRQDTAAILGMAFKGNNDDRRDSLSYKLRSLLSLHCNKVLCHDPYIQDPSFVSLEVALREADIVFLGACHAEYRDLPIQQPVADVFHFLRQAPNRLLSEAPLQVTV